jgi:SAM-dependent methyltransferase
VKPISDPSLVRAEYADERRFLARSTARWAVFLGASPLEHALQALLESRRGRVLDVGCGTGEFVVSVETKLGCEVVGVDLSERMVELTTERGVHAVVGDVQALPFADGEFDAISANWMLYHLPDLDRGLAEIVRVLRPGGRLVAVTNARDHLVELWGVRESPFDDETGEQALERHFARVERRDVRGTAVFATQSGLAAYVGGFAGFGREPVRPLDELALPLECTTRNCVFVAEKAA